MFMVIMKGNRKSPIFCPRCGSGDYVSYGKCWKCKECSKYWAKNPKKKQKGWKQWNKGLTKDSDERIKEYSVKQSITKRNNPNFIRQAIANLPPPKINISKEQLSSMYKTMTQKDIANELNISQSRISQLMKKYNIKTRSNASFHPHKLTKEGRKQLSEKMMGNINWRFSYKFPNSEERKLIRFFKKWNLPFKYVGDGSFRIEGKCPDFVWKERFLIIEFFGELWHPKTDEPKRIKFFNRHGWNCLVIWGKESGAYLKDHKTYKWERRLYDKIIRWLADLP